MNNTGSSKENIQLSLPVNAAYVSAARLTASSIANRMLFDIEEVEAVKVAVSEACTFVIRNIAQSASSDFTIVFDVKKDILSITISTEARIAQEPMQDEMGLVMIQALMDEFRISGMEDKRFMIEMVKRHKEISFN